MVPSDIAAMDAYVGGEMSACDEADYEQKLARHPELLPVLHEQTRIHRALEVLHAQEEDRAVQDSVMEILRTREKEAGVTRGVMAALRDRSGSAPREGVAAASRGGGLRSLMGLAAAVVALVGVAGFTLWAVSRSVDVVAVSGAEIGGEPLRATPRAGDVVRVSGDGLLEFAHPAGARFEFSGGDVVFPRASEKRVHIAGGTLFVEAEPQNPKKPFVITTPHAAVRVIGTALTVVAGAEASAVFVHHGKVSASAPQGREQKLVSGGQAVFVGAAGVKELGAIDVQDLPWLSRRALFDEEFDGSTSVEWQGGEATAERGVLRLGQGAGAALKGSYPKTVFERKPGSVLHIKARGGTLGRVVVQLNEAKSYALATRWINKADSWQTLSIPLDEFETPETLPPMGIPKLAKDEVAAFRFIKVSAKPETGLEVDRIWVTGY